MGGGEDLECKFDTSTIKIENLLGKGAFGKASKAQSVGEITNGSLKSTFFRMIGSENPKFYVVKELLPNADNNDIENAVVEAKILKHLAKDGPHPNILYYVGCNNTKYITIVTEYNPGYYDLNSFILNKKPTDVLPRSIVRSFSHLPNRIRSYFNKSDPIIDNCLKQLYDGLAEIHRRGVAHRDIKPENILIEPTTGNIKYIDFGLSSIFSEVANNKLTIAGTKGYIPSIFYKINVHNITVEEYKCLLKYGDYYALAIIIYTTLIIRPRIIEVLKDNTENTEEIINSILLDNESIPILYKHIVDLPTLYINGSEIYNDTSLETYINNHVDFKQYLDTIDQRLQKVGISKHKLFLTTPILSGYVISSTKYPQTLRPSQN
jgi:serine/threonine protein kinase